MKIFLNILSVIFKVYVIFCKFYVKHDKLLDFFIL